MLQIRGFHLNFESYRRMGPVEALGLVKMAAEQGLNTLLVEYGPRFPFERHGEICSPDALKRDEIDRLNAAAAESGIDIIPLQQSIAHLEYVAEHARYHHLREREKKSNVLCPCHSESLPLIKELLGEVIAMHPQSKLIHVGGDEARKVGQCPRCKAALTNNGSTIGDLYARYMGELARFVIEHGRRPVVWDDTFCAFPDALNHLPKQTIIDYWDYIVVADPTPVLIPRMAHIHGAPRVAHDWRWLLRNKGTLSDVQIGVMKNYSRPSPLRWSLGGDYLREFGRFLGEEFPRWIKALPYLEYYQQRGFDVITSPTGMGNGDMKDGAPNFARFDANIRTHAQRCTQNGRSLGIITTAWYNMPLEMLYEPLRLTAQCTTR